MKIKFLVCFVVMGLYAPVFAAKPPSEYVAIIKKAAPAVVNILADQIIEKSPLAELLGGPLFGFDDWDQEAIAKSLGSGVIVDAQGVVVTCHHVVRNAREIRVKLQDNTEYKAEVVTVDENNDIAVLRLKDQKGGFPVLELGDSDSAEDGDKVLAIGNAFGLGKVVSHGIISSRSLRVMGKRLMVTDAPINPGNSGGAIVDMEGKLLAIPNAIYSRTGASHGVGFALPVKLVQAVLESFKKGKAHVMRPWLGLNVQDIEPAIAESLGLAKDQTGVIVHSVHLLSPVKDKIAHNDMILQINGETVLDQEDFQFRLQTLSLTDNVTLKVRKKDGSQQDVTFTPIMPPENPAADEKTLQGNHPLNGITVANLSPAIAVQLGIDANQPGGVVVTKADSSSMTGFLRLPLQEGDIILELNGHSIENVEDLQKQLKEARRFNLTLKRQQQVIKLQIQ